MFRTRNTSAQQPARTVAFRLPPPHDQQLVTEAAKRGLSAGKLARQLVVCALSGEDSREQLDQMRQLREAVARLHEHLAAVTVAILHDAGKATLDEAVDWVHANIVPENVTDTYPKTE